MNATFTVTTKPTNHLSIKASYEKDGLVHLITKTGKLVQIPAEDYAQAIFEKRAAAFVCKTFTFKSFYHKDTDTYTNQTNTYTKGKKDGDGNHDDHIEWWSNHPQTILDGHNNSENILFYMTNLSKEVDTKSTNFRKRLKLSNFIEAIADGKTAHAELSSIMEYLGRNPMNMTVDQIVLALIGTDMDKATGKASGILLDETVLEDFNRTFVNNENTSKEIVIAVNKAINHKIIVQRQMGDARAYYWNENHIGVTIPEVRTYFVTYPKMLASLGATLDKLTTAPGAGDKLIPDSAKSKLATEKSKMIEFLSKADVEKYPELKDKNLALMSTKSITELYNKITDTKS